MAAVGKSLAELRAEGGRIDRSILDAASESEIERHSMEDDAEAAADALVHARRTLGMAADELDGALGLPQGTVAAWEKAALPLSVGDRQLIALLSRHPQEILRLAAS